MVTSCNWSQLKVITPQGDQSKVIYIFSQKGEQKLELAGESMTTVFSTNASRIEFITIQEALLAQLDTVTDEDLEARFLRLEEELLESVLQLKAPFDPDNFGQIELVAVPFAVFYFANWDLEEDPVISMPISLFTGHASPALSRLMQQFPLTPEGLQTIVEPNLELEKAFSIAAKEVELKLSNEETGRTSLIWCDTALRHQKHQKVYEPAKKEFAVDMTQIDTGKHEVLGLQAVEYLSYTIILVPHLVINFQKPVQNCPTGILDPVAQNMHLMAKSPL